MVLVRGIGLAALMRNRVQSILTLHELTSSPLQPGTLRAIGHALCLIKVHQCSSCTSLPLDTGTNNCVHPVMHTCRRIRSLATIDISILLLVGQTSGRKIFPPSARVKVHLLFWHSERSPKVWCQKGP